MKITFFGAAEGVTGAKFLIESQETKILVDCGLFQGNREIRQRNWDDFPIDASSIDAIVLTHAHIDHTGYIPRLVKQGFKGPVYCSRGTHELSIIMLQDSGYIQEEDAKNANKYHYSRHSPALPLYTLKDAQIALSLFKPVEYGAQIPIGSLQVKIIQSGHIIGGSFVVASDGNQSISFSGDLGRTDQLIMKSPSDLAQTDYLVLDSTYGDRLHDQSDPVKELGRVASKTIDQGGTLIIPAFSVGRSQMILYSLYQLQQQNIIPKVPVFLDSPMAIKVTDLYCQFKDEHKLPSDKCDEIFDIATYLRTRQQSKSLNYKKGPAIIIAGSGMLDGGRVLHHVKQYISDAKNTLLFVGYQATGTKGRSLIDGAQTIKIHGTSYPVRASIERIDSFSAHADGDETIEWLRGLGSPPKKIFLTHGDIDSLHSLKKKIERGLGWTVVIPKYKDSFDLK